MRAFDLVFLDVETGGRDPRIHGIVEIAALRTDASAERVLARYESRVYTALAVEAEAASFNGYVKEEWESAPSLKAVLRQFVAAIVEPFDTRAVVCGHNVKFDEDFVRPAFETHQIAYPFDYHHIDTVALAWPLLVLGKIESLRLRAVCDYFGISNEGEHRAMVDVERDCAIYKHLMKRYAVAS